MARGNRRYIPPQHKELIVQMWLRGLTKEQLATSTDYSLRTIQRIIRLWLNTGKPYRIPLQRGRPREMTSAEVRFVESLIERTPDMTLEEIQDVLYSACGLDIGIDTIRRTLLRHGWTRKKVSRAAREADEERRLAYLAAVGQHPASRLVFLDESACNRHTARRTMAWAYIGHRARRRDYFVRGKRYSVLPAISLSGILHLDILERSWTAAQFREYLDVLLDRMNPFPQDNSVLVMDNASVHHFDGIRDMVEQRGRRLIYLSPYSPDFNPCEEGFSSLKHWVRRNRDYALREMDGAPGSEPIAMLWNAVYECMTPDAIAGWFRDSGY